MTAEEKREKNRLKNIAWRAKNPDKVKKSQELFDKNHPGEKKEYLQNYMLDYRKTQKGRAQQLSDSYKWKDRITNRGECTITKQWILDNIFTSTCTYCGESDWRKLGCDRIDNTLPHTPENCICSCKLCNSERQYKRMSLEEFREYKQKGDSPIAIPTSE